MRSFFENFEKNIFEYIWIVAGIVFTLALASAARRLLTRLIANSYKKRAVKLSPERQRRMETASTIMQSASKYLVWFIAGAAVIGQLGLTATMNSMLAAAGIGGLALGIGAQSFIKDIVAGMAIVFEDQAAVGDFVEVLGVKGTVEEISLRTMVVKSMRGELHCIPNGSIGVLTNYSRADYLALLDIPVAYEADAKRAMDCLLEVAEAYAEEHDNTVSPPEVWGVTAFTELGITLRLVMKVKPLTHWATERALLLRIKERFQQEGIEIPYHKLLVTEGESA